MKAEFKKALPAVLVHEGGYVNHPRDPGGPTNRGVTQRVYDAWRSNRELDTRSVKEIEQAEVEAIYRAGYWDRVHGDAMPAGVGYVLFDYAVNSGPSRAIKAMQAALGVPVDGTIGQMTINAVDTYGDHDALIAEIGAKRMAFLRKLSTFDAFGKGWTRRVNDVTKLGQAWASGSVGPAVEHIPNANRKARDEDAKPKPSTAPADLATGAGVATGGAGGALQQAQESLTPLAGSSNWIGSAVAILALISAVLVIGGLTVRWWQTRRAAEHAEAMA